MLILPALVGPRDVVDLCEGVRERLAGAAAGNRRIVCDAGALAVRGLAAVELLARLQLAARRAGGRIVIRDPAPALRSLIALTGLPLQVEGEVEEGEPAVRVEEGGDRGDPAV
ncbi:STAS domain-containing protein [Streptomyces sp. JNUCC 64]